MNWYWIWRKLHCLGDCLLLDWQGRANYSGTRDEWYTDVGYCLDRYSVHDINVDKNQNN